MEHYKHFFFHREFDKSYYYPSKFNFGIIPVMLGCFIGMALGTIIFLSQVFKVMGW